MASGGLKDSSEVGAKLAALNAQQQERLARYRAGAVLFYKKGNDVRLGVVNPVNDKLKEVKSFVEERLGMEPQVYVISQHSLAMALSRYRREREYVPLASDTITISREQLDKFEEALESYEKLGRRISSVAPTGLLSSVLGGAIKMRASDVHVEPRRDQVRLRYRIDGVLQDVATFKLEGWKHLLSRVKVMSDLKLNIRDVPQEGNFEIHADEDKFDVRVSVLPGAYGENIVLRLLNRKEGVLGLDELGMKERDRRVVEQALRESTGMVLTAGPTGSGKTTTIVACLQEVNKPELKIITLEDPVEYRVVGIEQTEVDHDAGYTFAVGLRSILRQDPDIIFVGEMRDVETVETSVHAAMTGHLVFSTIHSNDAPGVVLRLVGMGVEPYVLAPALDVIIAQRLVRLLCKQCGEKYVVDRKMREHIREVMEGVPTEVFDPAVLGDANLQFYRPKGCKECGQTGYRGRIGVFEVLPVKGEIEEMVLGGADSLLIREAAMKQGMTTIRQDTYLRVIEGLTTIEEVERISEE